MRDLRDKLFPLSAVFLAVLVLVAAISILFRMADHEEVLTGPPHFLCGSSTFRVGNVESARSRF